MAARQLMLGLSLRRALSHSARCARPLPLLGQRSSKLPSSPRHLALQTHSRPSHQCVAYHATTKLLSTTAAAPPTEISPSPELYSPPAAGLLSLLPASWVPYA